MLKRSIAINCILIIFARYFDSSVGEKKTLCEERNLLVCTRTAYLSHCEHELNKKLIWVDLTCFYVKRKARRKEIQKMTEVLLQAITIYRLYNEKIGKDN